MLFKYFRVPLCVVFVVVFSLFYGCSEYDETSDKLPNEIRWVKNSLEYESLCTQVYENAWRALKPIVSSGNEGVIVMDLDETVMDNSQYQLELFEKNESYGRESWASWVNRGEAGLVPGAKAFMDSVRSYGNTGFVFISNRMDERTEITRKNLIALGVSVPTDIFLLRLNKADKKTVRRNEVLTGTGRMAKHGPENVLAYFGDAMGDFPQDSNYNWGINKFILPNPMYGKW